MDVGALIWADFAELLYLPTETWNPNFPHPHLVAVQVQIIKIASARPRSLLSKKPPPLKLHSWDFSPRPRLLSEPPKTKNPSIASDHTAVWSNRAEGGEPLGLIAVQVLVSRGNVLLKKKFRAKIEMLWRLQHFASSKEESDLSDLQSWWIIAG